MIKLMGHLEPHNAVREVMINSLVEQANHITTTAYQFVTPKV